MHIKLNDKELEALLKQMDADGNGKINFSEFKAAMAKGCFRRHNKEELNAAFRKFDSDGNGFLTVDELQLVMSKMGRDMNRSEVKSMIGSLDLNKDGKISFDEFLRLFE